MIEWMILIGVKLLKVAILGMMTLISNLAGSGCYAAGATVSVEAPLLPEAAVVVVVEPGGRLERVGRLVPPVRVEMTFTPDLLVPPRRDPSI